MPIQTTAPGIGEPCPDPAAKKWVGPDPEKRIGSTPLSVCFLAGEVSYVTLRKSLVGTNDVTTENGELRLLFGF